MDEKRDLTGSTRSEWWPATAAAQGRCREGANNIICTSKSFRLITSLLKEKCKFKIKNHKSAKETSSMLHNTYNMSMIPIKKMPVIYIIYNDEAFSSTIQNLHQGKAVLSLIWYTCSTRLLIWICSLSSCHTNGYYWWFFTRNSILSMIQASTKYLEHTKQHFTK